MVTNELVSAKRL